MSKEVKMKECTVCGKTIAKSAKVCPECGAKNKKPFYKHPWFIIIVALFVIGMIIPNDSDDKDATGKSDNNTTVEETAAPAEQKAPEQTPEEKAQAEHQEWIESQFSAWDGSHIELTKLIKESLNDEKSYEHINTTYVDVQTEAIRDTYNKILEEANYEDRLEVGDLFITTEFSAKNGFGGTIKNTAFGIVSKNNNTVTLVAIE